MFQPGSRSVESRRTCRDQSRAHLPRPGFHCEGRQGVPGVPGRRIRRGRIVFARVADIARAKSTGGRVVTPTPAPGPYAVRAPRGLAYIPLSTYPAGLSSGARAHRPPPRVRYSRQGRQDAPEKKARWFWMFQCPPKTPTPRPSSRKRRYCPSRQFAQQTET